jgi:hypothetical protein
MSVNILVKSFFYPPALDGNAAAVFIRKELENSKPSMIARFGSTEIKAIFFPHLPWLFRLLFRNRVFSRMRDLSGFFPATNQTMAKFSNLMIEDMKLLDILGSWRIEEMLLLRHFPFAKRIELRVLEPYLSENPWSEVLEGRKVLVVHPFNATIEHQYNEKRELLFEDKRVLPKFKSLETIKAVQTIAGNKEEFKDWFEALDSMKVAIDSKDYDVAILGCGAYGFPLAAHVKRSGKKAIHLGGATQILFGIKGRRWDSHPVISSLYNKHWVRPAPEDVPIGADKVEKACYW